MHINYKRKWIKRRRILKEKLETAIDKEDDQRVEKLRKLIDLTNRKLKEDVNERAS